MKRLLRSCFFSAACFVLPGQTAVHYAQGFYIEQFTAEDGLPGNSVAEIAQGQQGYHWMATHRGLVRYGGYDFKIYYPFAPSEREHDFDNFIYCLHPASNGEMWAGSLSWTFGIYATAASSACSR